MMADSDNLSINEIHLQPLKIHGEVKRRHVFFHCCSSHAKVTHDRLPVYLS